MSPRAGDALLEADWQKRVLGAARLHGWKWYHPPDNMRTERGYRQNVVRGWPDLAMVRGERLLFAELKKQDGRISPEQREWLAVLSGVPYVEVYVWRPSDWPEVLRVLDRRRTTAPGT